jgi:hypothetical protein
VPAVDPAPYCGAAQRWTGYLRRPPRLRLNTARVRAGRPVSVAFTVDKPAFVTVSLRRAGATVAVLAANLASGRRSLRWRFPPRGGGVFAVRLSARDLAGNFGAASGRLRVLRARARR